MPEAGDKSQQHPLFSGSGTVGIISGENPAFKAQAVGHDAMGQALMSLGLKAEPVEGHYGAPERSWVVHGPTREQMYDLGRTFGQESVIYSQAGRHELMHTNGLHAGRSHPGLGHEFFAEPPEDYYTHLPSAGGYLRLNFDQDQMNDSALAHDKAIEAQGHRAAHEMDGLTKAEVARALLETLKKALPPHDDAIRPRPAPHPHAYPWHGHHTDHHLHVMAPGAILRAVDLRDAELAKALFPDDLLKADGSGPEHINEQAAGVGVSTYAKHALPYGTLTPGKPTDLNHYPLEGKNQAIDQLLKDHGFNAYVAGGKHGRPDLATRNYNTKHLMIYDPSPGSGGDFGQEAYTEGWRKLHELAHAHTLAKLNETYGEGRRIGKLGHQRTLREALRAVHWEHLAAHKQRGLSASLGIHVPDDVFNREYNSVMHDAVHRAVTGQFTEPSAEGFNPHSHAVPLGTSLGMVREAAHNLGLTGMHDLLKKSEDKMADDKTYDPKQWRLELAKSIRERVADYGREMLELRQRELKKSQAGTCPLCGAADVPGSCVCLGQSLSKAEEKPKDTKKGEKKADLENHRDQSRDPIGEPIKTKPEEPVKAQEGSGGKVSKLKALGKVAMSGMGKMPAAAGAQAAKDSAAAAGPQAAAPKVKLPGVGDQARRQASLSEFMPAGKFTGAGAGLPKGTSHLKPPMAKAGMNPTAAAPKLAAPKLAAPKLAPAKPAISATKPKATAATSAPKPAKAPAAASPSTAPSAQTMKAEKACLKKSELGSCLLCSKAEHPGACK